VKLRRLTPPNISQGGCAVRTCHITPAFSSYEFAPSGQAGQIGSQVVRFINPVCRLYRTQLQQTPPGSSLRLSLNATLNQLTGALSCWQGM